MNNDINNINKRDRRVWSVMLHILIWAFFFGSAQIFFIQAKEVDWNFFWKSNASNLTICILFYINYLYLIPRYLEKGEVKRFVIFNIALLVLAAFAFQELHELFPRGGGRHRHFHRSTPPTPRPYWPFIIKDIIVLCVTIGAAIAVRYSLKWQKAVSAQKEAELGRTEAELRNLRSQINPHFLLNTLNNIYALIAFNQNKAQKAVLDLSEMLRYVLYDNQQEFTPLHKEAEFLKNYIELMRIRIPEEVKISVDIDQKSYGDVKIAPLIFISLVENAFKHGISPTHKSFIHISLRKNGSLITFVTENSHYPKTAADHSGSGIGLKQVKQRLDWSYPQRYTWQKGLQADGTYRSVITIDTKE